MDKLFFNSYLADGCLSLSHRKSVGTEYSIIWYGNPKTEKEYYDKFITNLWKKLFGLEVKANHMPNGCYGIRAWSKGLFMFLSKSLKIPVNKKSKTAALPPILKEHYPHEISKEVKAVLRGVMDGDFCVSVAKKKYSVHANLASSELVDDIYYYLRIAGFNVSKSKYTIKDARMGKTFTYYRVSINGKGNVTKWFEEIGTHNPNHKERFLKLKNKESR